MAHQLPAGLLEAVIGVAITKYKGEDGLQEVHLARLARRLAAAGGQPEQIAQVQPHVGALAAVVVVSASSSVPTSAPQAHSNQACFNSARFNLETARVIGAV